jgi:hypothetical protein
MQYTDEMKRQDRLVRSLGILDLLVNDLSEGRSFPQFWQRLWGRDRLTHDFNTLHYRDWSEATEDEWSDLWEGLRREWNFTRARAPKSLALWEANGNPLKIATFRNMVGNASPAAPPLTWAEFRALLGGAK